MIRSLIIACICMFVWSSSVSLAQQPNKREQKVRDDRKKVESEGYWKYNDLTGAMQAARKENKPLVVVLRCIPCEECVKLDDDLVNNDPAIRPLLDQYIRVRVVGTNGLDLKLFQFDTDQSFAVFLLNAEGQIYGRFGTRSHRTNWVGDVSLKGLAKALQAGLDLHQKRNEQQVVKALGGKIGEAIEAEKPEQFPSLKTRFTSELNYQGDVVKSCIHCHQISEARHAFYWSQKKTIPDSVLFPYPHPKTVGLILDPNEKAVVKEVTADSSAAKAGFKSGDEIVSLAGQPLISIADVQWVLHRSQSQNVSIPAVVIRNQKMETLTLNLPDGWKRISDIKWRASTWGLRRMVSGGMVLDDDERELKVKNVGQFGAHAAAKNAGVRAGDRIVSVDGKSYQSESEMIADLVLKKKPGEKISLELLRDGRKLMISLPVQE